MKDKIFGVLQRVGRSFMLPIALLPIAGLLLGIGSSFTNQTTLEAYGLTGVIYEGSILYTILDIMYQNYSKNMIRFSLFVTKDSCTCILLMTDSVLSQTI